MGLVYYLFICTYNTLNLGALCVEKYFEITNCQCKTRKISCSKHERIIKESLKVCGSCKLDTAKLLQQYVIQICSTSTNNIVQVHIPRTVLDCILYLHYTFSTAAQRSLYISIDCVYVYVLNVLVYF